MKPLNAYIINLDRATNRWKHIEDSFEKTSLHLCRVAAVDGNRLVLPSPHFNATRFRLFHGRTINIYEVACYLSHIKALQTFLKTEEEYAFIGEDDLVVHPGLDHVIAAALQERTSWNIFRLTGLSPGKAIALKKLTADHCLTLHLGRLKGAGAYLIDRTAAKAFVKNLLPMWLPWDHAFDREWFFGLHALSIAPFPISQTKEHFPSTIQKNAQPKLSTLQRWMTTYPYQSFNELTRYLFRFCSLIAWKKRSKEQL